MLLALLAFDVTAQAQTSSLRWAGLVNEATILESGEVFAVEGGGRIRHRDVNGVWTFQSTSIEAESMLRRVFALQTEAGVRAFAVGIDGDLRQKIGTGPWEAIHQQLETASGVSGRIVVREPDADPNTPGNQPVWRDRSVYSNLPLTAPDAVTLPGYGVAANGGTASNGIAYATSMGGYIRRTSDGGQSWVVEAQPENPVLAEQWRVRDVAFIDTDVGWMVTQFNRIARTDDGGKTWSSDSTNATLNRPFLKAIALDGPGLVGVAVGQYEGGVNTFPTILINDNLANTAWIPPTSIEPSSGITSVETEFHDVDWVNGAEFWAVGRGGLIVYSDPTVGLDLWRQYVPPSETYATFSDFDIDGVAFATSGHGVLVGSRIVDAKLTGKAYHAERVGTTINWTEIPIPGEASLRALTDVDFDGTTAYATGIRDVVGGVQGVVLKATLSAGVFSDFVAVAQTFSECAIGDAATSVPILTEVEIAPGGAVWIGGQCGKLWKSTDGGVNWSSVRSQTDAHVRGMSFPAADTGFIACHRQNRSGHCVIRILP